jgi:competence protein ComEC
VALLVGMIFYLGIRIGMVRETMSWSIIIVLPIYAILTGASPSVNRAVIMCMLFLIARHFKCSTIFNSIQGLCISFLLLTLVNPFTVYNIGFQLSYTVTMALLLSLHIMSNHSDSIVRLVITSYISSIAGLPLLLYHFFEIPLYTILANLLFVPLYSLLLPGFMLLYFLQFFSIQLFELLSLILTTLVVESNKLAIFLSKLPWAQVITGKPTYFQMILYIVSVLFSFYYWEKKPQKWAVVLLPWIVVCVHLLLPNSNGEVTFIDVGQGDSIFIRLPYDQGTYLIDTGGSILFNEEKWKRRTNIYHVGEDVIVPFLKSKGVTKLDLLIITHGDMDHIGGSLMVLEEMDVKHIIFPVNNNDNSKMKQKLIEESSKKNIPISYVHEGMNWKKKDYEFTILSPPKGYSGDENDGSIVLHAKLGGAFWLFTGDLGREGEMYILNKYPQLSIDILKVGHHGSKTSTSEEFILHYQPEFSVISVGEKNRFGHPHNDVLSILTKGGSKILRTDIHGGITYIFRGKSGTFIK